MTNDDVADHLIRTAAAPGREGKPYPKPGLPTFGIAEKKWRTRRDSNPRPPGP